jgi:hypothetical protein
MVTRNPNRSIEILWYKTGYAKRKILSPLKRPTWGRLRCWFYFILLRICSPLLFFCSSYHVSDSSVSEQYLQIFPTLALVNIAQIQKNMIFLTLAPMNKYTKFVLKEKRNYFYFLCFFCYLCSSVSNFLEEKKERKKKNHCCMHVWVIHACMQQFAKQGKKRNLPGRCKRRTMAIKAW